MTALPGPFHHHAAWQGEELLARPDWICSLNDAELREIDQAQEAILHTGLPLEQTKQDHCSLPNLGPRLRQIQRDLEEGSGACMIQGLPVENWSEEQARRVFWGLTAHLGTAVSQSATGERIFSVRDEGYRIGQPQARGPNTRKRLSFHTDRCDVIAFLCLRQARSGGENQIVSSMSLYNEMCKRRPDLVQVLMQPFYYQRHNVDLGNARPWCRQPIFSHHQGHFAGSFLRVLIERAYANPDLPDMTPIQKEALDYLEVLAAEPQMHVTFRQKPGDLLLLNNWVTFHRRNKFVDHDDSQRRRHLLRIWLAVPNSRPLAPEFADNYGSTEAGAVRGGMPQSDPSDGT